MTSTFTSTTDGNINDGGTYGNTSPGVAGTDFPDSDDICVAGGSTEITLNVDYEVRALKITGTVAGGGNTITVNGATSNKPFDNDGTITGDLNVIITNTGLQQDGLLLDAMGTSGNINDLTLNLANGTAANQTIGIADTTTIDGKLTITSGTFDTVFDGGASQTLTILGDTVIGGGTLKCNASTINLRSGGSGSTWGLRVNSGTFNGGTGTHNIGGGTLRGGSWIWSNGTTTLNGGETSSSASTFYASGGTFTAGTGTVVVDADATLQWLLYGANITVYNLTVTASDHLRLWQPTDDGSGTRVLTVSGDLSIAGTLDTDFGSQDDVDITVTGNTSGAGTLILNNSTYTSSNGHLSMTGTVTIGTSGVITGVDQLGETSSGGMTLTCTGSPTLGCRRWRQLASKWTPATSTLKVEDGTYSFQDASYGVPYNFEIDNGSNTNELAGTFTVTNNLIMTAGTLDTTSSNHALTVSGQLDMNGGTLTLNGSTFELGNLDQSGGTINGNTSTINLNTGTGGGWVWYRTGGTWHYNTSTVVYKENGKHMEGEFYNLTIECASSAHTGVWRADGLASVIMKAAGALTVKEGHWKRDSTTESMEVVGVTSIESGGKLGNATSDDITANDTFTGGITIASSGEFIATRGTSTLSGNLENAGTFTHNSGTVATGANISINITNDVDPVFYNFTNNNTVNFGGNNTRTFTIQGTHAGTGHNRPNGTITLNYGTSSASGTINTTGYWLMTNINGTCTIQATDTTGLNPVQTNVNNRFDESFGIVSGEHWKWANINILSPFRSTEASYTNAVTHTLMGDVSFAAVTIDTGDTLDLNGQRAVFGGAFDLTTGALAMNDAMAVFTNTIDFNGRVPTSNTGTTIIHNPPSTSEKLITSLYFGGTFFAQGAESDVNGYAWGGASGEYPAKVFVGGQLDCQQSVKTTTLMQVATGGELRGNDRTLTCEGDFTTSGGLIGKSALTFDGTDDYVDLDNNVAWQFGTNNFTLEAWFKSDSGSGNRTIIANGDASDNGFLLYMQSSNNIKFFVNNIAVCNAADVSYEDGKWHHVAAVRDGNDYLLYIDGKLKDKSTQSAQNLTHAGKASIGARDLSASADAYWEGEIAMVRVFKGASGGARTQSEIRADMFNDSANLADSTDLMCAYDFNEGSGAEVDNIQGNTNFDGDITGATWVGAGTFTAGTSTLTMAKSGSQKIFTAAGEVIYAFTVNAGSTTDIECVGSDSGSPFMPTHNVTINGTLSSTSVPLYMTNDFVSNGGAFAFGGSADLTGLNAIRCVHTSGTIDIPAVTTKLLRCEGSGGTTRATGDLTLTTELQVDSGTTFNANGNTITSKEVDLNGSSTLDLASSTLILSSTDGLTSAAQTTLNGGPGCVIDGDASGQKVIFQSQGHWEIVGNISDLNVTNEELVVHGQVTNCTGDIHQWLPHFERDVMLDSDTSSDTSIDRADDIDRNNELIN